MNRIMVTDLFDTSKVYFNELFDGVLYPWSALSKIDDFISAFDKREYREYAKGVYIGEGVEIHPSAVIIAPVIIGRGSVIRPSAYIRGSVIIGENCVVGNSTEIKNSILFNNVQVPHYNYVGDSLLGNFSHLGAGTICSNLKADGKSVVVRDREGIDTGRRKLGAILGDYANIGCNCVLNPGTVIGKNTAVYPALSIRGILPPNSIVKSNENIVDRK